MNVKPFAWCLAHNNPGITGSCYCCCYYLQLQNQNNSYSNAFLRYVPVEDLLEIYKKLYGREVITKNAIVDCSYLQFLEM